MLIGNSLKIFKEFWPHIFPEDDCIHPRHYAVQVQPMTSWTTEIHCTSSKNTFLITGDWDHYSSPTREIRKIVFHCLCLLLQLFKYASWSDHQTWEHPPPHTHTQRLLFWSLSIWLTLILQLAEPRMENQWRLEPGISIDELSGMSFLCHLGPWRFAHTFAFVGLISSHSTVCSIGPSDFHKDSQTSTPSMSHAG